MTGVSIHGTGMTTDDIIRKAHDTLPVATSSAAGVVKIGSGVSVTGDGTISVAGGGGGGGGGGGVSFVATSSVDDYDAKLTVTGASATDTLPGQTIWIEGGPPITDQNGGDVVIRGGAERQVEIRGGPATTAGSAPGAVTISGGGPAETGPGGSVTITAPSGTGGNGGSITLQVGGINGDATGHTHGQLILSNIPAADPTVADAIWSDNGVLVQSGHTAPVTTNLNVSSIDWTTAPTSDPAQTGALWNDGGTLKISAG